MNKQEQLEYERVSDLYAQIVREQKREAIRVATTRDEVADGFEIGSTHYLFPRVAQWVLDIGFTQERISSVTLRPDPYKGPGQWYLFVGGPCISGHVTSEQVARLRADRSKLTEICARVAHEVNRRYCLTLNDASQLPWEQTPEWQKLRRCALVEKVLDGSTPEQSHDSWCSQKFAEGWTYGPVKNLESREHPCLVPYAELTREQRLKDVLFVAVVRALADSLP